MGNSFCFTASIDRSQIRQEKLDMSRKTGVLNLSEQGLTNKSSEWHSLADDVFTSKLKSLDISSNNLGTLPDAILMLKNIKILKASNCSLRSCPSLDTLTKLSNLCLSNNCLDGSIFPILPVSLQIIDLSGNSLTSLPGAFSILCNVVVLNISSNSLYNIDGISSLVSLEDLILDDNLITTISPEIGSLSKLRHLSIKRNKLQQNCLPESLFVSTMVDHIELDGNTQLKTSDILKYKSIEIFLERRRKTKDKSVSGGGLTNHELFGLP